MLRRTSAVAMLSTTGVCMNFFPLGRSSGPKMIQKVLPPNLLSPRMLTMPKLVSDKEAKTRNYVPRHQLKLHCSCCQFYYHHDALAVRCSNNITHNQREQWMEPTWIYYNRLPLNYNKYIFQNVHPKTGALMNRESTHTRNNERRAAGLSTRGMKLTKEGRVIARRVSGVGSFSGGYFNRFPLPT